MQPLIIIPARYASTRFPGKPLAIIHGKPMIQYVYENCKQAFDWVYVATDDSRIVECVNSFGGKVVMTSANHPSGTDRCAEAAEKLSKLHPFDIVINVQGDEPSTQVDQLKLLASCFQDSDTEIATLISPITTNDVLFDQNKVKVVSNAKGFALYFSRQAIPFVRDHQPEDWLQKQDFFMHLGIYAYKAETLKEITNLKQTDLEKAESLEQLRWIENGYNIKTATTNHINVGIDTPADLERFIQNTHK